MEHNKQNRQSVKGEQHNEGKIGNPERRHGGRCGLERDDEGRFGAGRSQWKPLFNRQLWSDWGQLCRRVTCGSLRESHQEGAALG